MSTNKTIKESSMRKGGINSHPTQERPPRPRGHERPSTHVVPHALFTGMLISAVRYALPRHTGVVCEAEDWITQLADGLNTPDLEVLYRDIQKTIVEHQHGHRKLHDCDFETWRKMLNHVEDLLKARNV